MSDCDSEEANSTNDSEYLDDDFLCDSEAISDISNDNATTGMYNNELEYLESELQARKLKTDDSSDTPDSAMDSSPLENLHWCSCENCVVTFTMTLQECKCCRECNIPGD